MSTGLYFSRGKDKDETGGTSDLCSPVPQWISAVGLTNKCITSVQSSLFPRQFYLLSPSVSLSLSCFQVDDPGAALTELETHLGFPLQGFVPYTRAVRPSMEIPRENLQKYLENVLSNEAKGIAGLFALQPESLPILEPLALSIV